jgi:hypothetical protein
MSTTAISAQKLIMRDLAGFKRIETYLNNGLTPNHTVGQAIEYFLEKAQIRRNNLDFLAFSRGVRLDSKLQISQLEEPDTQEWTILPEISAGRSYPEN